MPIPSPMRSRRRARHWLPCVAAAWAMIATSSFMRKLLSLQRRQQNELGERQTTCCGLLWTGRALRPA
eukprot:3514533-Pyramimonas_sp.AAC.1